MSSDKPLKPLTFWIATSVIILLFLALFGFWTASMVKNFRSVSATTDTNPSPKFEAPKIEDYKRLFPE